jgi:hypothetical protein
MDTQKIKDALKLIKEAFASKEKFTDAKLNDGTTIIRFDGELAVGTAVMAVTEQGELPLPDGDYTLEDGTMFTTASGIVTAVTPADQTQTPPAGDGSAPATPAAAAKMNEGAPVKSVIESIIREQRFAEDIAELKEKLAAYEVAKEAFSSQSAEDKTKIEALESKVNEYRDLMLKSIEAIEKIGDEPSTTAAESQPAKKFDIKAFRSEFKKDIQKLNEQ